jgi:hypothetical protein
VTDEDHVAGDAVLADALLADAAVALVHALAAVHWVGHEIDALADAPGQRLLADRLFHTAVGRVAAAAVRILAAAAATAVGVLASAVAGVVAALLAGAAVGPGAAVLARVDDAQTVDEGAVFAIGADDRVEATAAQPGRAGQDQGQQGSTDITPGGHRETSAVRG